MFSFPVLGGATENQLSDPSSIVLTASAAKSLFADEDPIGKVIKVDDRIDLTVTAVVMDAPSNSSFSFDCLIPFTTYMNQQHWVKESLSEWSNYSFNLYVEFDEHVDQAQVAEAVRDVIRRNSSEETDITFLPMERWRLYSDFKNGKSVSGLIVYVRIFTAIALFILIIACINFTNLATARSEKRAREVGVRKAVGSGRKELVIQFMGETLITAFLSFVVAVGLVEIALPGYNVLVGKSLRIDYANPLWYGAAGLVIALTGFIAGSYPALYLSSFRPATVLKGRLYSGGRGSLPRKVLVATQFFFSIVLIISTTVIYYQLHHLRSRPTGYNVENLLTVPATGNVLQNFEVIKNELLNQNLAETVTSSSSPITAVFSFQGYVNWSGKREGQRASFATVAVNRDYSKTLGIRIVSGRDFSPEFADSTSIIVNEAAVAYMGLKDPIGETVEVFEKKYTIVGVMENVVMLSPTRAVDPTLFIYDPSWISHVTIRLPEHTKMDETLSRIESVFRRHNPAYPFTYRFTDQDFEDKFTNLKRIGYLSNIFSSLAIAISCLGLFGLAAFTVEQRTKEIGIRKVLGATVSHVVILISRDFTRLIAVAFVLATPLAGWLMSDWLSQFEYRIAIEWWIPVVSGIIVFALALSVVSVQALRAAIANPASSLKSE